MKNLWLVLVLVLMTAGCGVVSNSVIPVVPAQPSDRVTLGMTRPMVSSIMDGRIVVRYQIDAATGSSKPVDAQSLYSSEIVKIGETSYQVDQYLIRTPMTLEHISALDLFTVVYKDGLVVARGADALKSLERGAGEK